MKVILIMGWIFLALSVLALIATDSDVLFVGFLLMANLYFIADIVIDTLTKD